MEKIKIIDLLNKIANGEDVPKKIRYQAGSHKKDLYTYNEYTGDYEREIGLNLFVYLFMKERITGFLNDEVEVEIIEEDKKIEKIKKIEKKYDDNLEEYVAETYTNNNWYKEIYNGRYDEMIIEKINEIIEVINGKI